MRLLALVLLSGLLATTASAQVSLGVAGGLNFASLNDVRAAASETSLENSTGYHVGVTADVSIPLLSFRTGVFYLQAGDVETTGGAQVVSADFVTVPVELRLTSPTPIARLYVLAGPEARFPVGESDDVLVDMKSVNVAANVGIGAEFGVPFVGPTGFVELRYAYDATGFAQERGLETESDYRLNLFMVRAGIGL